MASRDAQREEIFIAAPPQHSEIITARKCPKLNETKIISRPVAGKKFWVIFNRQWGDSSAREKLPSGSSINFRYNYTTEPTPTCSNWGESCEYSPHPDKSCTNEV